MRWILEEMRWKKLRRQSERYSMPFFFREPINNFTMGHVVSEKSLSTFSAITNYSVDVIDVAKPIDSITLCAQKGINEK